jgi:hypothetical protein
MEPLNDRELNDLLRQWDAPGAPRSLEARILPGRRAWWQWLFTGTIRVPVPVGIAAIVLFALWMYSSSPPLEPREEPVSGGVSLADFQPVEQLEPQILDESILWGPRKEGADENSGELR